MIILRERDEITEWYIAFYPHHGHWWTKFIPGRWKHCAAFSFSRIARTWVFLDVSIYGVKCIVLPASEDSHLVLAHWTAGAGVLKMPAQCHLAPRPRLGMWCVPFVKHLIGIKGGAVRPDALWKDCLRQGAEVISDGATQTAAA